MIDRSKFLSRRFVAAVFILLAGLVLLWWALWSVAAGQYRGVIDGWIDTGRAAGYQITYDDRQLFGFPRRVVLRFTNLHWRNADGIDFHVASIDIGALPWRWHTFDAKFKDYAEIDAPLEENRALILGAESGTAHVELDQDGTWHDSRLSLDQARVGRTPDFVFASKTLDVKANRPTTPPASHKDTGLTVYADAGGVTLPSDLPTPFGPTMDKMQAEVRIMDVVPDFRLKSSVDAWNKDSGVVEIDNLHLEWGNLLMTARGTLGFDDDLQPEGAFVGQVRHEDRVLKQLMQAGFIEPRQEEMLSSALTLFAKPSSHFDDKGVEIPITVQLGGLFLGPVKIFSFPEIKWPESVPK